MAEVPASSPGGQRVATLVNTDGIVRLSNFNLPHPVNQVQVAADTVTRVVVNGSAQSDRINLSGLSPTTFPRLTDRAVLVYGNGGNDVLGGSAFADWIEGGAGEDAIKDLGGGDVLLGGTEKDTIHGDGNGSQYQQEKWADYIDGGAGNDTLHGGAGSDTVIGGPGRDDLANGGLGNDTAWIDGSDVKPMRSWPQKSFEHNSMDAPPAPPWQPQTTAPRPAARALQPGVYVAARDLDFATAGGLGRHQYVILVPETPGAFPGVKNLGDGTSGLVIGTHNVGGRLVMKSFETGDYNGTLSYVFGFSGVALYNTEVGQVDLRGQGIDATIRSLMTASEHYASYTRQNPISYPSLPAMLADRGVNSNSWAQSIIRHVVGPDRVRANFSGADLLWSKQIGREYFISGLRSTDKQLVTSVGVEPGRSYSFASVNFSDRAIRHRNFELHLDPSDGTDLFRGDASFVVREGRTGSGVSFESVNFPGRCLRHRNFEFFLDADDGTDLFKGDSTFYARPGLTGEGVSFESANLPGWYVRHQGFRVVLSRGETTPLFQGDASFVAGSPLAAVVPPSTPPVVIPPPIHPPVVVPSPVAVILPPEHPVSTPAPPTVSPPSRPTAPGNVEAANVWREAVDLNWTDRSTTETGFVVSVSTDGRTFREIGRAEAGAVRFRATDLRPYTRYWFKVAAVNDAGVADSNFIVVRTRA